MKRTVLIAVTLLALIACNGGGTGSKSASQQPSPAASVAKPSIENGRSIFLSGRDIAGEKIVASPAALRPSCAACHGANGAGGVHFPDGAVSADLRHRALVTQQNPPYSLSLLERAISTGIDNKGQKLDPVMPRWKLSQRDLHDVSEYVLTELK
jgi:mono/diheme cytochrome c family protein